MALYLPDGSVHIGHEYDDLARRIQYGDSVGWSGDTRLSLNVGVISVTDEFGRTKTGRRLEVYRWNEDGSETLIGHWRPDEQFRICTDLAKMRAGAEGRTAGVESSIDRHNDAMEEKHSQQWRDHMKELLLHAHHVHTQLHETRTKFFMGGGDAARA
jgi:hypothetical protein